MSGRLLISLFAGLLFAVCAGQSVADMHSDRPDPSCMGNRDAPLVIVNLKTKEAYPECVRARVGSIIQFRFISEESLEDLQTAKKNLEDFFVARERLVDVTVRIVPDKPFENDWLKGRNDYIDDAVIIRVPDRYDPSAERRYTYHEYRIVVSDKKIDPRIEVEH